MDKIDAGVNRRSVLLTASAAALAATAAGAAPALAEDAGYGAPLVDVVIPAGVLDRDQKAQMIKGITDVLVRTTGLPRDASHRIFVQIFETAEDGFGVNGQIFVPRAKRPG